MSKKKPLKKTWSVSEKLEIVQARQQGMLLQDLSQLYGVSQSAIITWMTRYETGGIAGLEPAPRGGGASKKSARVEAAEAVLKEVAQTDPEAGVSRAQGALYRHGLLSLARETVRRLWRGQGHGPQLQRQRRRNRPAKVKFFERANPNELWQTDIMTFMLKAQYRVYLIGFMDDHSRLIVGWGLYRFQTAANVQEVFRAAIEKHGLPKEVLSDNGRQYYSWRGKSQFSEMLLKLGIRHIRSRPYHPQTCGKIESFWRNVIQECLAKNPLSSFEEAKEKIGEYIEYYNFKRPHQGIGNLTPSDRFYRVGDQVKQIIAANTAKVEEAAVPAPEYVAPTYIVGNIGGKELRVIAKDAEVSLREPEKIESAAGGGKHGESETSQPPGTAGTDPIGPVEAGADPGAVRASGSVPGTVLPLDGDGAPGVAQGAGSQDAGAEGGAPGKGGGGDAAAAGTGETAGAGVAQPAPGAGPLEAPGGGVAADHPAQRLEPAAGAPQG